MDIIYSLTSLMRTMVVPTKMFRQPPALSPGYHSDLAVLLPLKRIHGAPALPCPCPSPGLMFLLETRGLEGDNLDESSLEAPPRTIF